MFSTAVITFVLGFATALVIVWLLNKATDYDDGD